MMTLFDSVTKDNINRWLQGAYDKKTKDKIEELIQNNPQEAIDAFYTNLSFGTGGLRGIMGVGCNRMNEYTVRSATQGLANYLIKHPLPKNVPSHQVLIGFDSRHQSRFFAEECARVLAANGFRVSLFKELRPTPLVSFGCRYLQCSAGIMITASHNPPEYNGYKVYWNDGAQILPPHDKGIIDEVKKIRDNSQVKTTDLSNPLIKIIDQEIDEAYLAATSSLQLYPKDNLLQGNLLKVIYSNLHGAGITLVPKILNQWGFTNLLDVDEQKEPNGSFPTTASPNPEEREALSLGIKKMLRSNSDLLLATDPDADRLGVAVNRGEQAILLNGNQVACLCLEHICQALTSQQRMPEKAAFIKTIVTTELFKAIAEAYGKPCFNVLTGFKYIAELINQWEQDHKFHYVFGGEESYGYLLGTLTRDKDAVTAAALVCEMALQAKLQKKDLITLLHELYQKYGVYREGLLTLSYEESKSGKERMEAAMIALRKNPPLSICNVKVSAIEDYLTSPALHQSNVLLFWMADGSKIVVRPSGTEPKIKLYVGVVNTNKEALIKKCDQQVEHYLKELEQIILKEK